MPSTTTATTIINNAAFALEDTTNKHWTRAELFGYVNDGQRDLAAIKPDAYVKNGPQLLAPGVKQTLPADARALVRLGCNLGNAAGTIRGRVPRQLDLGLMGQQDPNWQTAPAAPVVMEYGYDERDPLNFYVSPPQPAQPTYVELVYFAIPANLANEAAVSVLGDEYCTALEHYVIYRAYLKEGEMGNPTAAAMHRAEFLALLGVSERPEAAAKGA